MSGLALIASGSAAVAATTALRGPVSLVAAPHRAVGPASTTAVLGGVGVIGWWLAGGVPVVLVSVAVGAALAVTRLLARARAARVADRRSEAVLLACDGMAADLAAGQPPLSVLRRAAADWPELAPVASAGELDADVPTALRAVARLPGAGQLRAVAAAWQVAHRSGGGLALALARTASSLREDRRTLRLVSTELAAAHATARMIAVLPVLVLGLGAGIGGDPVGFLLGSPVGLGCLVAGLLLTYAGTTWLHRIADTVLER